MCKRLSYFFVILVMLFSCSRKVEVVSVPNSEPAVVANSVKPENKATENFYSCKACDKIVFRSSETISKEEKTLIF